MNNSHLFRKEVVVPPSNFKINHDDQLILVGSCFTSNIASFFSQACFQFYSPFGTLYNPVTIANNFKRIVNRELYTVADLVLNNERYYSWNHSSFYSGSSEKETLLLINDEIYKFNEIIKSSSTIIITFGTSMVYEHKEYGLVGNCHKIPSKEFTKKMLSIEEMHNSWRELIQLLNTKQIIFTVSPVRHWSDGAIENTRSKALLHLLISSLEAEFENTSYFPSYELIIDELRDYRFYKKDMLHPSQEAVEFIWEKFAACYFTSSTIGVLNEVNAIRKLLEHKPFNPSSVKHQKFLQKCLTDINTIQSKTPHYSWKEELEQIKAQIEN